MNHSPRVLSIVWNLIRGGTEGQCARLAMELARRGCVHRVAAFRREGFFLEDVDRTCGPVHHFAISRMVSPATAGAIRELAAFIRHEAIDVVHAWDCDAAIFGAAAARLARVPLITSHRDLGEIYPTHKLWLMRRVDANAVAVVVNAQAIAERWAGRGVAHRDVVCIPNILDLDEFDVLAARTSPLASQLPAGRRIGMVARLDPEKDPVTLVLAAEIVCAAHKDVSFVLAGEGPERQQLEALVRERNLAGRVILLGDVPDVPALCRNFCIGALVPRANEGLSNTILEYMAAGLPVVATDCGGNRELVRNSETGFLVPVGDARAIADALMNLLANPGLCASLGRAGRARVSRDHRPAIVAGQLLDLYRRVATA